MHHEVHQQQEEVPQLNCLVRQLQVDAVLWCSAWSLPLTMPHGLFLSRYVRRLKTTVDGLFVSTLRASLSKPAASASFVLLCGARACAIFEPSKPPRPSKLTEPRLFPCGRVPVVRSAGPRSRSSPSSFMMTLLPETKNKNGRDHKRQLNIEDSALCEDTHAEPHPSLQLRAALHQLGLHEEEEEVSVQEKIRGQEPPLQVNKEAGGWGLGVLLLLTCLCTRRRRRLGGPSEEGGGEG